jgi:hypothetical protein
MKAAYIGDSIIRMHLRIRLSEDFKYAIDLFEDINSNRMFYNYCYENKLFIKADWNESFTTKKKITADYFEAYIYYLYLKDQEALNEVMLDYYNFYFRYKKIQHKIGHPLDKEGMWPKSKRLEFTCPLMSHLIKHKKI